MTAMGMGSPPQQRREPEAARGPGADPGSVGASPPARARPTSMQPSELGFTPQHPVHWLSPTMLATTALQVVLSSVFGEFLDKRELQGSLPDKINDERPGQVDDTEVWFDFVADLGDGFDPTYSIAYLLAQDAIEVDGTRLPRGQFLMMGGDEIYPTPSSGRYDDKTYGPYKAAMPNPPPGVPPALYALPGNHDWYDGLSSFLRLFARNGKEDIGGWLSKQARSYFAIRLPQRWWLLAVDMQFGAYIDQPQLDYFARVAAEIQPDDKIILCTPTPAWVEASWNAGCYDSTDFFIRTVLNPTGAEIRLMLSGDLHHYARYEGPRQLIHCGGGGAYLYPTHRLPESLPVPPPPANRHHHRAEPTATYALRHTFPSKKQSRRYAAGVFWRGLTRNPGFIGLVGTAHTLFMASIVTLFVPSSPLTRKWLELPIAIMVLVLLGGGIAFANSPTGGRGKGLRRIGLGIAHGVAQIALGVGATWLLVSLGVLNSTWPLPIVAGLGYLFAVGLVAAEVFFAYMLVASSFGINLNELFSAQAITESKSFLRMHINADGALTIYPVQVPTVSRSWVATPEATVAHASWLEPRRPIGYGLTEPPVVVR
jgi:hypothetical protein